MIRKFALVAGLTLGSMVAGNLLAQTSSSATPAPSSSTPAVTPAQDSAKVSSPTSGKMHHAAWTKDQIKAAQEGLAKAGYYKGQPTGVMNKKTKKALRAYQKANNLPVTGRLSNDVLTKLQST